MTEEINITTLFIKAAKGIKQNLILLIILIVAGSLIGLTISSFKTTVYKSSALYKTTLLENQQLDKIITQINENLKFGNLKANNTAFAGCQLITLESTETSVHNNPISELVAPRTTFFTLSVETSQPENLDQLNRAVEDFLISNSVLKRSLEARQGSLKDLITRLESVSEDTEIDAEQMQIISIQRVMQEQYSTFQELALAKVALEDLSIIEPLQTFYIPREPINKSPYYILYGSISTLILGLIIKGIIKA